MLRKVWAGRRRLGDGPALHMLRRWQWRCERGRGEEPGAVKAAAAGGPRQRSLSRNQNGPAEDSANVSASPRVSKVKGRPLKALVREEAQRNRVLGTSRLKKWQGQRRSRNKRPTMNLIDDSKELASAPGMTTPCFWTMPTFREAILLAEQPHLMTAQI